MRRRGVDGDAGFPRPGGAFDVVTGENLAAFAVCRRPIGFRLRSASIPALAARASIVKRTVAEQVNPAVKDSKNLTACDQALGKKIAPTRMTGREPLKWRTL